MNGVATVPHIERLDFFNGQRLFAEDLQTLDGFNRQMRWLHNRSLHTFGIGSGFVVQGKRGDREVTIGPGYAIDDKGREIILLLPRLEAVPPVAGDASGEPIFYDLTVHYPRNEDLEELETRTGLCGTSGAVRRREEPVFCWVELNTQTKQPVKELHIQQLFRGEKIVLARVSVKNCKLETLAITPRRNVRQECLPYVACGSTLPGATEWQPWTFEQSGIETRQTITLGVEVFVETASARFVTAPCYTARVAGERVFLNVPSADPGSFIIEGFSMIDDGQTARGFTLRVLLLPILEGTPLQYNPIFNGQVAFLMPIETFLREHWHVEWMGVEG